MTTKDEALKLALRVALENFDSMESLGPTAEAVIAAAQQWYLAEQPAQQQEPVVRWVCKGCRHEYMEAPSSCDCMESREYERVEYFTSPPASKPWVGLTDKEYQELHLQMGAVYFYQDYGRAIEAKLREKNT